ncbi:MAG: PASTA domain-containing protein [Bacteroides sp.]|nr:PASTA domain-containing protein [Bacteroides sp.]
MTIKEFFSFKSNKYFWGNLLAMVLVVVALLVGVLNWLDSYTRHGEAVVVPEVKGLSVKQAEEAFARQQLVAVISDSTYIKDEPAGCVLDCNPSAGHKVKKGRIVYLTVNTQSVPLQLVPDVADNSSLRQAEARLLASGFKLDSVKLVAGEKDWVYGVRYNNRSLAIGEKIPMGATVTLEVGDGGALALDSLNSLQDSLSRHQVKPATTPAKAEDSWF